MVFCIHENFSVVIEIKLISVHMKIKELFRLVKETELVDLDPAERREFLGMLNVQELMGSWKAKGAVNGIKTQMADLINYTLGKQYHWDIHKIDYSQINRENFRAIFGHIPAGKREQFVLNSLKYGLADSLIPHLPKLTDMSQDQLVKIIIEANWGWELVKNMHFYHQVDKKDIAIQLLENRQAWVLIWYRDHFMEITDWQIVQLFIQYGEVRLLVERVEIFPQEVRVAVGKILKERGYISDLLFAVEHFPNSDLEGLKTELLQSDKVELLLIYAAKFKNLDLWQVAQKLLQQAKAKYIVSHLEAFPLLMHLDLAQALLAAGEEELLAKNIPRFKGADNFKVAEQFLQLGCADYLHLYWNNFCFANPQQAATVELRLDAFYDQVSRRAV